MKEEIKKLDYIDTLRGIAVLAVLLVHTGLSVNFKSHSFFNGIVNHGAMGVQLFYIASAFTLFLSFNSRAGKEQFPVKNFFVRRVFRIAPMYYLGIIYYIIQNGRGWNYWLGDAAYISWSNILSNVLFLHGFNPYWINSVVPGGWSIAIEMTFYLCLPFIFLRVKNRNDALVFFIITLLLNCVLNFILHNNPLITDKRLWGEYLIFYFPNQLPVFALGILMYFCIVDTENKTNVDFSGKTLLILGCIVLIELLTETQWLFFPEHILFSILFFIVGIALSKYKPVLLVNPVINYIGKVSFSMYLVHFAVLYWLKHFGLMNYVEDVELNFLILFYIVVLLTVAISSLTYKVIEMPFQKIGKNIIDRMELK